MMVITSGIDRCMTMVKKNDRPDTYLCPKCGYIYCYPFSGDVDPREASVDGDGNLVLEMGCEGCHAGIRLILSLVKKEIN